MEKEKKIEKENVEDILPLTAMQDGLLYQYLSEGEFANYEQFCYRIKGNIQVELLKQAMLKVVDDNEMLRTVFRWNGLEQPIQIVLKNCNFPIKINDLTSLSFEEQERKLKEIRRQDREKPILIQEHPMKVEISQLSQDECEVMISYNIIIVDGWSNGIILKELLENYTALQEGKESKVRRKRQYRDYIKYILNQDKEEEKKFWTTYLNGFQHSTALPLEAELKEIPDEPGEENLTYLFPEQECSLIFQCVQQLGVTLAAFFYYAWGLLLHYYSGESDVVFGATMSGRPAEIPGIEEMVGVMINTMPVRVKFEDNERIVDCLRKMNQEIGELEENSYVSYSELKSYSGLSARDALFHSLIVVQNYPLADTLFHGMDQLQIHLEEVQSIGNCELYMGVTYWQNLKVMLHYNTQLYDKRVIQEIWDTFHTILTQLTRELSSKEKEKRTVKEIEFMPKEEQKQMISVIQHTRSKLKKLEEEEFGEFF